MAMPVRIFRVEVRGVFLLFGLVFMVSEKLEVGFEGDPL